MSFVIRQRIVLVVAIFVNVVFVVVVVVVVVIRGKSVTESITN